MDGFIFILFILFFVLPFLKRINKTNNKSANRNLKRPKVMSPWGLDHGQVRQKRHQQLHKNDSSNVFPEDHDDRVRARDQRDRLEYLKMERNIHSRKNSAMTRVSNKSRTDWGTRGESGLTSTKGVLIFLLLLVLAHFIVVAFAPNIIPGN